MDNRKNKGISPLTAPLSPFGRNDKIAIGRKWVRCFGAVALAWAITAGWSAAETRSASTTHFFFEYDAADEGVAAPLIKNAEAVRRDVTFFIGHDFKAVTRVVIAADDAAYDAAQPRAHVPEWSVGAAFPRDNLIVLRSTRTSDQRHDLSATFRHELSHIVLGKALAPGKPPRWLDEGIAEFQSSPWTTGKTWSMTVATLAGKAIPLHELMYSWPKDRDRARLAYLQSQAFVDYLYRRGSVSGIVQEMAAGADAATAVEHSLGFTLSDMEEEFREFFERHYTWVHILASSDLAWGLASVVFLVVVVASYIKTRRKLRRMELEDRLEDIEDELGQLKRRKKRRPKGSAEDLEDYLDNLDRW